MIKLSKGGSLKLAKDSDALTHIVVGMGWEVAQSERTVTREVPVKSIGNFFRKLFGGKLVTKTITEIIRPRSTGYEYDLDASCALFDKNDSIIHYSVCGESSDALVFYNNKKIDGIRHGGDNLTGSDGLHDDETIDIQLDKVFKSTETIAIFMNIYQAKDRKQSFADLTKAYLRIVNATNGEEMCRYDLTQFTDIHTALVLGFITRDESGWTFTAVGESLLGNYPREVANQIPKILKQHKTK
jgi:tellurium resistance protein TerD